MDTLPWYRQPWPWFLMGLPALAVVASVTTAVLAVRSNDGVVAADYYKRGLAINAELARRERTIELGLSVEVAAAGLRSGDRVTARISGQRALPADATLQLRVVHPGRAEQDRVVALARVQRSDDGLEARYAGVWNDDVGAMMGASLRQWSLESANWRIDGDADWRAVGSTLMVRAVAR